MREKIKKYTRKCVTTEKERRGIKGQEAKGKRVERRNEGIKERGR
jgi:hypothetical protein